MTGFYFNGDDGDDVRDDDDDRHCECVQRGNAPRRTPRPHFQAQV